jgi:hypothetical protein
MRSNPLPGDRCLSIMLVCLLSSAVTPALAVDHICLKIEGATSATMKKPFHVYITEERIYPSPTLANAAAKMGLSGTRISEEIFTGTATFVEINGKWRRSPINVAKMRQDSANDPDAKEVREHQKCFALPDETVGGESTSVYRTDNSSLGVTTKLWISKSHQLPLKAVTTTDVGAEKSTASMRYDYNNVQAPPGVK